VPWRVSLAIHVAWISPIPAEMTALLNFNTQALIQTEPILCLNPISLYYRILRSLILLNYPGLAMIKQIKSSIRYVMLIYRAE